MSRSLPKELNPAAWEVSARSAECARTYDVAAAYGKLDVCYSAGGSLVACRASSGYDDALAKFQACLAGSDVIAPTSATVQTVTQPVTQTVIQPATSKCPDCPGHGWQSTAAVVASLVAVVLLLLLVFMRFFRRPTQ